MKKYVIFILLLSLAACGGNKTGRGGQGDVTVTGAGATFPLPYYNLAFKMYKESAGVTVTYGGIGSGGGIRSLTDKVVDFAGSDAFLSDNEMNAMGTAVVHIPTCLGAVVPTYNLPGVKELRLTGDIIADIYLGKIKRWNDERLKAVNEAVDLPDIEVSPVYRSDGSGTTYVFSDYLSKVNEEWRENVGTGKALKWPAGIAAKGNPGVAGTISQVVGAIGYVGSEYAFAMRIPMALLQNRSGKFTAVSSESISAAAEGDIPADTRTMITDSKAENAYPISCFTWMVIYREQSYKKRKREDAEGVVSLMNAMLGDDIQKLTLKVHYSPLPGGVVNQARELLRTVTFDGKPVMDK